MFSSDVGSLENTDNLRRYDVQTFRVFSLVYLNGVVIFHIAFFISLNDIIIHKSNLISLECSVAQFDFGDINSLMTSNFLYISK